MIKKENLLLRISSFLLHYLPDIAVIVCPAWRSKGLYIKKLVKLESQ